MIAKKTTALLNLESDNKIQRWEEADVINYVVKKRQHILTQLNAESAQYHLLIKRQDRYKKGIDTLGSYHFLMGGGPSVCGGPGFFHGQRGGCKIFAQIFLAASAPFLLKYIIQKNFLHLAQPFSICHTTCSHIIRFVLIPCDIPSLI